MWFRNLGALGLFGLCLFAGLQSCGPTDHSGDPGLITVTVDSSAMRFSRLLVVLDADGNAADTLFDDSLRDPAQLRRIATAAYRGEKAVIALTGYRDGVQVYRETRDFDGADPAATRRDTVQDLAAALSRVQWSAAEIILTLGDTTRSVTLATLPSKADDRVDFSIGDSSVARIRIVGKGPDGAIVRLIPLKAGPTYILARSRPFPLLGDSLAVLVSAPVQSVFKPVNRSPEWSSSPFPVWLWSSGGGKGIGYYRVRIDNDSLAGGKLVNDTAYQGPDALGHGTHILYAQERDSSGVWSLTAALPIKVDLLRPNAPAVANDGLDATREHKPAWKWETGGEGAGIFRYLLDGENLEDSGTVTAAKHLTAPEALPEGPHTLRVQERDSAGNWSESGSATVNIVATDSTPPNKPLFHTSLLAKDAMTWGSGGGGGSGHYRYLVNRSNFEKGDATETDDSSYTPPPDSINTHDVLYVQERDSVGNWSVYARVEFGSRIFSFLQSKVQNADFVLTLIPDSNKVRLAHRMVSPENDSERTLQHMQLWDLVQSPAVSDAGYYIVNPFTNLVLTGTTVQGGPIATLPLASIDTLRSVLWYLPIQVPPAAPGTFKSLTYYPDQGQRLNIAGDGPWNENNAVILWEASHGEDNEEWRFTAQQAARYVK